MIDSPTEWFQGKTVELENDVEKKIVLTEMKSLVFHSDKKVVSDIARNVSLNAIFDSINEADDQEIELICTLLFELLSQIPTNQLFENYGDYLHEYLNHSSEEVKGTILKLLQNVMNEDTVQYLFKNYTTLLLDAIGCLSSPERSTAQNSIIMCSKIGSTSSGVKILYSKMILNKLKEVMSVNDTVRFRVYEIVNAVSKISAENLTASVESGLMGQLILEISSPDILIQLNALELFSNLATSNHGLTYLQECKVIQRLVDKLLKLNEEPLSLVLLPGLIEFFGNLCALQPQHFNREYPKVINLLFNSLDTKDEIILGVIITIVGKIGSTCSGRLVLKQYTEQVKAYFKKISEIVATKSDLTVTAMNSLCELMKSIDGEPSCNEVTQEWMDAMGTSTLHNIVNLSKLPFVEFRLAALSIFKAIVTHQWGTRVLSNYPGMVEFLLDRSSEFNKEGKQLKYDIIYNMTQCPNVDEIVAADILENLREYVKEGPYFVPTQTEMATEGI